MLSTFPFFLPGVSTLARQSNLTLVTKDMLAKTILATRSFQVWRIPPPTVSVPVTAARLHDIAIANLVWCMDYKRGVGGGVVYCAMDVQ